MLHLRQFWATLLVAFLLGTTACIHSAQAAPVLFPDSSITLEDGDIILSDGVDILPSFNREFGYPKGPYSHASVYIELPEKGGQIVDFNDSGMHISDPERFMSRSFKLAILRPIHKPAPGALARAFEALSERNMVFDFDMVWPSNDSRLTYCAGFVSQLFRLSGLPGMDPFPRQEAYRMEFWNDWAQQHLGMDLSHAISPNAILSNAHFRLLAEYDNPSQALKKKFWLTDSTLRKVMHYLRNEQMEIAPPSLGSRLVFAATDAGWIKRNTFTQMPVKRRTAYITIYEFTEKVKARVERTLLLNEEKSWDEDDVRTLTESVADAYRNGFFMPRTSP